MMQSNHAPEYPNIAVLFEDNHVLVVEKPVNIPSQEDASGDPDMLTILRADLKTRYNKPGNVYLGLVHRLDRPVGGAMVFAKTSKAASRLSEAVRSRSFDKEYYAVVHGTPSKPAEELVHYLRKDARTNTVSIVDERADGAKKAVLEYSTVASRDKLSLVRIRLHTGRPHQIRVQMNAIGCPLVGDQKYGARLNAPGQQIALWSASIGFPHPITKERVMFRSVPPDAYPWNLWGDAFE